jgi:ribosome-binding factor A
MVDVARARKLAVRIREVVSMTLETQVKDPRLGMVTITDAKVTPTCARPRCTTRSTAANEERQSSAIALESAKACCGAPSASRPG